MSKLNSEYTEFDIFNGNKQEIVNILQNRDMFISTEFSVGFSTGYKEMIINQNHMRTLNWWFLLFSLISVPQFSIAAKIFIAFEIFTHSSFSAT